MEVFVSNLQCEVVHVAGNHSKRAALLFHPWAWLGGSMWDPVVEALMRYVAACLAGEASERENMNSYGDLARCSHAPHEATVQSTSVSHRAAADSGLFSMVVRYNVRGAGESGGMKSFSAASDAADAFQICKYVWGRCGMAGQRGR